MTTADAVEIGTILEFLGGITSAGVVPTDGMKKTDLKDFPNLKDNLPISRYSVVTVVTSVKRLSALLEENGYSNTLTKMDELREALKEMEDYLEMNPSTTSFLRDPFAEELVTNTRKVKESFHTELATK